MESQATGKRKGKSSGKQELDQNILINTVYFKCDKAVDSVTSLLV